MIIRRELRTDIDLCGIEPEARAVTDSAPAGPHALISHAVPRRALVKPRPALGTAT
jgi:hypothetical protein